MKKNSIKKILISLIAIILVIGVTYTAYATDGNSSILDEINDMLQNENGNTGNGNENLEEIPEGTNTNTGTNINTNTNSASGNVNTNENLPDTTPYAGVGDYTGLIFVAIFAVSAIYAYKKIRDYKA